MDKNKIRFGLKGKFIVGLAIIVTLVTAAAISIGAYTYWNSITEQYNTTAYQTAKAAAGYFTEEEMRQYSDLVTRFNHGEASQDEIDKMTQSDRYKEIWDLINKLRISMDANDIYVNVFDMDILKNFDEGKYEAKEWNPVYYIMDSYYDEKLQFQMGQSGAIKKEYREDTLKAMESGKHMDRIIVTNGDFGYNLTASYPVVYNGETVAAVAIEIPMSTLETDIRKFINRVLIVSGLAMLILLIIGIIYIIRYLVRPIEIVVSEAEKFVDKNTEISEKLSKIKTRDEIQVLSRSILQMEIDINEYIENIKNVTAEKERIGAELNVATQIQADMMPSIFPAFPGRPEFDIYASMKPAKEVGGDFYDFFLIDDDHLAMVMADVSGKGVPAALFMVIAKTLIKNRALLGEYSPSKILSAVNDQLCEGNKSELFVTVWLAILEISTGKGKAANAGHEHPVIKRRDGEYQLVEYRHSPAVATMEGIKFREHDFELAPGDSLFVYTDGVPEATNKDNVLFGTDRMLKALNENQGLSNEKLLESIKKAVDDFVGKAPQFDDLTMLGFTYYGKEGNK